jgi:hypothetical protein
LPPPTTAAACLQVPINHNHSKGETTYRPTPSPSRPAGTGEHRQPPKQVGHSRASKWAIPACQKHTSRRRGGHWLCSRAYLASDGLHVTWSPPAQGPRSPEACLLQRKALQKSHTHLPSETTWVLLIAFMIANKLGNAWYIPRAIVTYDWSRTVSSFPARQVRSLAVLTISPGSGPPQCRRDGLPAQLRLSALLFVVARIRCDRSALKSGCT